MKSIAVFDIGSNTVLVTVGRRTHGGKTEVLLDEGDVVRLAEGLHDGHPLDEAAKARVLTALRRFQRQAQDFGVEDFLAAGTAAFRRASDGTAFARRIESELNIPVRILSGDEEARYSYQSARMDFEAAHGPVGMIDIGGGSTEFVFGAAGPRFSLPLGTVRLTEKFVSKHPVPDAEWKNLRERIRSLLQAGLPQNGASPLTWAAVAATPASLASVLLALPVYDPEKVHGFSLGQASLESLVESLRKKSISERRLMPGMHPKRAELLPVGGLILAESMRFLQLPRILVSDHGLRYGLLDEQLSSLHHDSTQLS